MSTRIYIFLFIITFIFGNSINGHACDDYGETIDDPSLYQSGKYYDGTEWHDCEEGYYCTGDGIERCCPENFPNSTPGNADIENCYTPCAATSDNYDDYTKDCGLTYLGYYNANEVSCKQQDGVITYEQHDEDYHVEPLSNGAYGCYYKHRQCSDFHTNTCSGNMYGSAEWRSYEWDISNCECKQEVFSDESHSCNAKRNKKPSASTISGVNVLINYATQFRYWCVSCFPGYYVKSDDILDAIGNNQTCIVGEESHGGRYAVCACTVAPQGTWIASCNITYPITNPDNIPCSPTNCPAGKTTSSTGSTSIDDCHYTDQTKFCDAKGCFNITDAADGGWNWTDIP